MCVHARRRSWEAGLQQGGMHARARWVSGGSDLASSPSAADAMDVGLDVPRHVKVDDVRDALNIEAARRHVRCKHERRLVVHEAL